MPEEVKKKVKRGLIKFIIFVLLVLAIAFAFGIKIRFFIRDELTIGLSPLDTSFSIKNNEPVHVKFDIKNKNFLQCKAECEFTLTDLRNNGVIHSSKQTINHNQEVIKGYNLPAPGKGSGQSLYNFEVECKNIKSVICLTKEIPRYRSAIISVNFELNDQEAELKPKLKTDVESWLSGIRNASILLRQNELLFEKLQSTVKEYPSAYEDRGNRKELDSIRAKEDGLIQLWKSEDYISLNQRFKGHLSEINRLNNKLAEMQKGILNAIRLRNDNIDLFTEVLGLKEKIMDKLNYYLRENNAKNNKRLSDFNDVAEKIYSDYSGIKENKDAAYLSNEVQELKSQISILEEIKLEGLFRLMWSESLLDVKEGVASTDFSQEFDCTELRNLASRIDEKNSESLAFKANYTSSVSEELLDKVREEIELKALLRTKDFILKSSIYGKERLLELADREIALRNTSTGYFSAIPVADLYNMALLNNSENRLYLEDNCRDISYTETANTNSILNIVSMDISSFKKVGLDIPSVKVNISLTLSDNPPMCCVFDECQPCCTEECGSKEELFPVLFIHGHMVNSANSPEFAMDDFAMIQRRMQDDGFINLGELNINLNPFEVMPGEWGRSGKPISTRASFYYIAHYDVADYSVEVQKSERIENYAIRLKEIIDLLKFRTGADKVNIVAHSMGGLVAREYLDLFGYKDVNKIITINTPHHGISGRVRQLCSVLGASKECKDMSEGSIFLSRLNSRRIPEDAKFFAIRSSGCAMDKGQDGDGIVVAESAKLEWAENFVIEGKCTDSLQSNLHTNVLDPGVYPQTYGLIVEILTE